MKNTILSLVYLLFISTNLFSQLTLSPNSQTTGICPGVDRTFTINGIPSNCGGFTISLQSGSASFTTSGNQFTVNATNIPQNLVVVFDGGTDPDCPSDKSFTIPVISVSDEVPIISGCPGALVAGISSTIVLTAEVLYDFKGTSDPSEVASYTWSIVSGGTGWTLTTSNAPGVARKTATLVTDNCSSATIRVIATDHCGNVSLTTDCTINRFAQKPSLSGATHFVICCDQNPIALTASQATAGLNGYTYTWGFGSWSGVSASNFAIVTPSGTSAGNISVNAQVCGLTSQTASLTVPLEIIEPSTMVGGDAYLCSGQIRNYRLNIDQEPCANVSWAVTPLSAVTPSSGVGSSVNLTPNGSYTGPASIEFIINTPCGTVTRTKAFHVGTPKITMVGYDGSPGGGTFNQVCSTLLSHSFTVNVAGDFDGCVDEWDDNGSTATNFGNCTEFDWTFPIVTGPTSQCAFITASASNECGEGSQNFIFCENPYVCKNGQFFFSIIPNPSTGIIDISLIEDKDGLKKEMLFTDLEIIDEYGNLKKRITIEALNTQEDLSSFPDGKYYVRTLVEGEYVITPFLLLKY